MVCNQVPNTKFKSPNIDFVKVDFPSPSEEKGSLVDIDDFRKDKVSKVFAGILHGEKYRPTYVMLLDADDLISSKISQYVNSHPGENGWYINKGFIYGDGGALVRWTRIFHMKCGSSFIFSWELLRKLMNVPQDFPSEPTQAQIWASLDTNFLREAFAIHRRTESYFRELGFPLKKFPFPAGIWVLDTGENHSGKSLLNVGYPASNKLKTEFSLEVPPLSLGLVADYLSSIPTSLFKISRRLLQRASIIG